MALTNPNKAVSVERLNYFKNKLGDVFASKNHTHSDATTSSAGFMSASDKTKLDGLTPSTGVLEVEKGGTGQSTLTANSVLAGDGTNAVKNISSASGALYATASGGVPKFGTLPIAQGGTGSSYSDFSSLCDAVGSGGNWVDVSTKLLTEITMYDTNFHIKGLEAFIYEKNIMCMSFSVYCDLSLNQHSEFIPLKLPTWANPKNYISSSLTHCISQINKNNGNVLFHIVSPQAAGSSSYGLGVGVCYLLETPYDPS